MNENRFKSIDVFKGFAIIGIVFVHIFIEFDRPTIGAPDTNVLMEFLYSGLMMFFVFAGYFCKMDRSFLENVKKRALQLGLLWLICIIVLPFFMWAYLNILGRQPVDISEYFATVGNLLTHGTGGLTYYVDEMNPAINMLYTNCGYYFIEALFFGLILFYAIATTKIVKSWKLSVIAIIVLVTATFLMREFTAQRWIFSIQLAPLVAAYAIVGILMKEYGVLEYIETQWKTKKYWLIFGIFLIVGILLLFFLPSGLEFIQTRFAPKLEMDQWYYNWRIYVFVPSTLIACYVLMVLASLFSKTKISGIFSMVGEHTLGILMLHSFVIKMIAATFWDLPPHYYFPAGLANNTFAAIAVGLIAIVLCIAISILARKAMTCLMKKIGKNNSVSVEQ